MSVKYTLMKEEIKIKSKILTVAKVELVAVVLLFIIKIHLLNIDIFTSPIVLSLLVLSSLWRAFIANIKVNVVWSKETFSDGVSIRVWIRRQWSWKAASIYIKKLLYPWKPPINAVRLFIDCSLRYDGFRMECMLARERFIIVGWIDSVINTHVYLCIWL